MCRGLDTVSVSARIQCVSSTHAVVTTDKITGDRGNRPGAQLSFILPTITPQIEVIAIDIQRYATDRQGSSINDWKRLNNVCEHLPPLLQKLVVGFISQEDMSIFIHQVANSKLDNLRKAGKLMYAVSRKTKSSFEWLRASPDSEELTGMYPVLPTMDS